MITTSLVNAVDVARMLGVSRARVAELVVEHPPARLPPGPLPSVIPGNHFPQPRIGPAGYRLWDRSSIENWALRDDPERKLRGERPKLPAIEQVTPAVQQLSLLAQEQARELNHRSVDPDHLILALAQPDCPGLAPAVLNSLGLSFHQLQQKLVDFYGDPFEPHDKELSVAPATWLVLGRAAFAAAELQDEEVASEHLLIALAGERPRYEWSLIPFELAGRPIWERVLAVTEAATPLSELPPVDLPPDTNGASHPAEPELARSPTGDEPRRLKTILRPEHGPRAHLILAGPGRGLVTGRGSTTLVCGACSAILAENMEGEHQLSDTILKCTACGAFNAIAATVEE